MKRFSNPDRDQWLIDGDNPREREMDARDAARDAQKERALNKHPFDYYLDPEDVPTKSTLTEDEIDERIRAYRLKRDMGAF